MFCFSIRWRKASRCKKLIRRVRRRLRLLRKRRVSILKQLREDITQLLIDRPDHLHAASPLVEQLVHGEGMMAAYDLLDHFCELIVIRLSYIRKNKECPNDVNEAVSSLIFASSRCGDLPELREIRGLFGAWYGQRFATTALELLPGNLVNWQVKDKLSVRCVREDEKKKFFEEMAIKYGIQTCPLAIDCSSETQMEQEEEKRMDAATTHGDINEEYNNEEDNEVVIKNTNKSQQDDQSVYLFETPLLLRNEKRHPRIIRRRRRRRKGTCSVVDIESTVYYKSCCYQRRIQQKRRNSYISNENLCYLLAVAFGCLSEQNLKLGCCHCWKKEECEYPSHVHPKLPNWEELHASFVALRRAHVLLS